MTTVVVTGIVAPVTQNSNGVYGIDYLGIFGPAGGSIAGLPFTVVWEGISDCIFPCNPITSATITISDHSYNFGSGSGVGNTFGQSFHQVQTFGSSGLSSLTTREDGDPLAGLGVFYIEPAGSIGERAFLNVNVPGPIIGEGLGFAALLLLVTILWKTRTIFVDNPSQSCHHAGYGPPRPYHSPIRRR